MTQIHHIKADAEKHQQEVLTTTNVIQDTIEKNNVIFSEKWEATHDRIDRRLEETRLLKNQVVISRPCLVFNKPLSSPAKTL